MPSDGQTGLGGWSADDFWRALHHGKAKDGRLLYPAFPYPNYTQVTRADSDALYAFLKTLAPVAQARQENTLRFPYNQRALLLAWRALYFQSGGYVPHPAQSAHWNRGAVFGPMSEVVYRSLQHLSDDDLQAMAGYLKALPQPREPPAVEVPPVPKEDVEKVMDLGSRLYLKHCADCHGANGAGHASAYPPLAGNRSLTMATAVNPIRLVLNGGYPPGTAGNPRPYGMPPFRSVLSNDEVAAVVSYIRNSWGNRAGLVSALEVGRFEAPPVD